MPTKVLTFFNSKSGAGKTTLTYNLAHMFARRGLRVLMVDFDPQSTLTSWCITEDQLEQLWSRDTAQTVHGCVLPLVKWGRLDLAAPIITPIDENLGLLAGDTRLSVFEGPSINAWSRALNGEVDALRVVSVLHRIIQSAARDFRAHWVFMDLGSNLGILNRAALLAANYIVMPIGFDLPSTMGVKRTGDVLYTLRCKWEYVLLGSDRDIGFELPNGYTVPLGYIPMQTSIQPIGSPINYVKKTMKNYYRNVLLKDCPYTSFANDPCYLGDGHMPSELIDISQEVGKPVQDLKQADLPSHLSYKDVTSAKVRLGYTAQRIMTDTDFYLGA